MGKLQNFPVKIFRMVKHVFSGRQRTAGIGKGCTGKAMKKTFPHKASRQARMFPGGIKGYPGRISSTSGIWEVKKGIPAPRASSKVSLIPSSRDGKRRQEERLIQSGTSFLCPWKNPELPAFATNLLRKLRKNMEHVDRFHNFLSPVSATLFKDNPSRPA